jgi:hypothetical protein
MTSRLHREEDETMQLRRIACAALALALCLSSTASGQTTYTFTRIADNTGALTGFNFPPAINNSGTVAFQAVEAPTPQNNGPEGVFTGRGGPVTTVADSLTGPFSFFAEASINDNGDVAFVATSTDGSTNTLFKSGRRGLTTIVTTGDGPNDFLFIFSPSINEKAVVAFSASTPGGVSGSFRGSGGPLTTIVASNNTFFLLPAINDKGDVTVPFISGQDAGIVSGDGGPVTTLIDQTGPPGNFGTFTAPVAFFGEAAPINNKGAVAFLGFSGQGASAIFKLNHGAMTTIAETTTGSFIDLGSEPALNNRGNVAFLGTLPGGAQGIFTGPDPVRDKVIQVGDALDGSTVSDLTQAIGHSALNDGGAIAFVATLSDGRQGIFVAKPKGHDESSDSH